jgi:hypothetical protein
VWSCLFGSGRPVSGFAIPSSRFSIVQLPVQGRKAVQRNADRSPVTGNRRDPASQRTTVPVATVRHTLRQHIGVIRQRPRRGVQGRSLQRTWCRRRRPPSCATAAVPSSSRAPVARLRGWLSGRPRLESSQAVSQTWTYVRERHSGCTMRPERWRRRKPGRSSGRMGSRCGYLASVLVVDGMSTQRSSPKSGRVAPLRHDEHGGREWVG